MSHGQFVSVASKRTCFIQVVFCRPGRKKLGNTSRRTVRSFASEGEEALDLEGHEGYLPVACHEDSSNDTESIEEPSMASEVS